MPIGRKIILLTILSLLCLGAAAAVIYNMYSEPIDEWIAVQASVPSQLDNLKPNILAWKGRTLPEKKQEYVAGRIARGKSVDLHSRVRLLGYYQVRQDTSPQARVNHQNLAIWFIDHFPAARFTGSAYVSLDPELDGEKYDEARKLWFEKVDKNKDDLRILGNTAGFVLLHEMDFAEKTFIETAESNPNNAHWQERLGYLYSIKMRQGSDDQKQAAGQKCLSHYDKALELEEKDLEKFYLLSDIANAAFDAGDMEKATSYAEKLLELAEDHKANWNYANAIHRSKVVLGKVALESGDADKAAELLIESANSIKAEEVQEKSVLMGFDTSLAMELIPAGKKDSVLEFLAICKDIAVDADEDEEVKEEDLSFEARRILKLIDTVKGIEIKQ